MKGPELGTEGYCLMSLFHWKCKVVCFLNLHVCLLVYFSCLKNFLEVCIGTAYPKEE